MAGNGLPIYYKNSKLVVAQSPKKRWKEYYLLVCTIVGFIILIAGVLWFVPSIEEDKSYYRAYNSFTGPSVLGVTDTSSEPEIVANPDRPSKLPVDVLKQEADNNGPEIDPRQRRLEENRPEPVPVPGRGRPNNIEGGPGVKEMGENREGDAQEEVERGGNDVEHGDLGEDGQGKDDEGVGKEVGEEEDEQKQMEDPVTRQRKEKIIEVRVCMNYGCTCQLYSLFVTNDELLPNKDGICCTLCPPCTCVLLSN